MPVTNETRSVEFRPPSKKAIIFLLVLGAGFLIFSFLKPVATFYTDSLLFDSLSQSGTFRKLVGAKFVIPSIAFALMTLLVALTIFLATKFGKKNSFTKDYDDWILPLSKIYKSRTTLWRNAIALIIGFGFAGSTVGYYKEWILFNNAQKVGEKDPLFHKDIGFYLFELPFIRLALAWLFSGLVILIFVAFFAHYINGSLRFERAGRHITVAAKVHLSILCALAGLVKAAQYYFDRFALVNSTRGAVDGAAYTEVHAVLPGLRLLIFVAIIASILLIVNVYRKGVVLPVVAIALWLIISVVIGSIYPLVVQNFVVKPSRNTKEKPYAERNITATKKAFDINTVETKEVDFQQGLTPKNAEAAKTVLQNSILWDEDNLAPWFDQQKGEQIYEFGFADRDRYKVDGKTKYSFISARELVDPSSLPDKSWQSRHVTYTHGFGAAIANGTEVIAENEPDYFVSELPSKSDKATAAAKGLELDTAKARVYFGEGLEDFVFVGSNKTEQTPTDDHINLDDLGGVQTSNAFKRAAFALRFSDYNILIADAVNSKSKIVYERNPAARVKKLAPFLDIDSNPYPVVSNGEISWIVDAYTTSNQYPYSQYAETDNLSSSNSLNQKLNYVRNSVKAIVNARTGDVKLYIIDKNEPIAKAYAKAFPSLFSNINDAPKDLVEHFRYPEDIFDVQTEVYSDYHVSDPTTLLKGSARWQTSPGNSTVTNISTLTSTTLAGGRADKTKSSGVPLNPLYQYINHTSMDTPEFLLTRSFVPISSTFKMNSFMSASSETKDYGKLRLVEFNSEEDTSALSPTQVIGQINQNKEFSQEITLLDQRGSDVLAGPLQIIPVADTVIYVQPVYVRGQSKGSRPVLTYLTVSDSKRTVCAPTIDLAVDALISGNDLCVPFTQNIVSSDATDAAQSNDQPQTLPTGSSDLTALTTQQLIQRLNDASNAYEDAKEPLDLGALQKAADQMVKIVQELNSR